MSKSGRQVPFLKGKPAAVSATAGLPMHLKALQPEAPVPLQLELRPDGAVLTSPGAFILQLQPFGMKTSQISQGKQTKFFRIGYHLIVLPNT